jgi:beta-N-acetylglucosaminidase
MKRAISILLVVFSIFILHDKVFGQGNEYGQYFEASSNDIPILVKDDVGKLIKVGNLIKGEVFPRVDNFTAWHEIEFGNRSAYISKDWTSPSDGRQIKNLNSGYKNSKMTIEAMVNVSVYDNTSGRLVPFATILKGVKYPVIREYTSWYTVSLAGRMGYIRKNEVKLGFTDADRFFKVEQDNVPILVKDKEGNLNQVGKLIKGEIYPIIHNFTAWHEIKYGNKSAYIPKDGTSPSDGKQLKNLNKSYKNSGITFETLTEVPIYDNTSGKLVPFGKIEQGGEYPLAYDYGGDWVYVLLANRVGFVKKDLIKVNSLIDSYLEVDLRKPANITAQDIVNFFNLNRPDSPLKNYAQNFINAQNKHGVNATYLVAHAIWETGWGGSNLIEYKNNLYGYGAYNVCPFTCGYYFSSIDDGINAVAYMVKTNYLDSNGDYYVSDKGETYRSTLLGMNVRYATDQNWKYGISNLMEGIKTFDAFYYTSKNPVTSIGPTPSTLYRDIPDGLPYPKDIIIDFPSDIKAVTTTEGLSFRTKPYTSASMFIDSLAKGTEMTILGYNEDVRVDSNYPYYNKWYRIRVNGIEGWVYGEYIDIQNLIYVNASDLNIRKEPKLNGERLTQVSYTYLKAVLKNGVPNEQSGWYQVYLPNSSSTGWVSGDYDYIDIIKR